MDAKEKQRLINITDDALLYEIQMLINTSKALVDLKINNDNGSLLVTIRNALVESFAIHSRILLDFLYSKRNESTDVIADDFFDNTLEWKKKRPKMTRRLLSVSARVGKEIAHLSYKRLEVDVSRKGWSLKIAKDIISVLDCFICSVPANRTGKKFRSYINIISQDNFWNVV